MPNHYSIRQTLSHYALSCIPGEDIFCIHSMYEDRGLEALEEKEVIIDLFYKVCPGQFVSILVNDSVSSGCFSCDFYSPDWSTWLCSRATWEQYQDEVMQKEEEEWISEHWCHCGNTGVPTYRRGISCTTASPAK